MRGKTYRVYLKKDEGKRLKDIRKQRRTSGTADNPCPDFVFVE
jgi:hypothetical protein